MLQWKKGRKAKDNKEVEIVDLGNIFSFTLYFGRSGFKNYLMEEKPDVIINIVDSTNIERNLYLTTQLTK